MNDVMQNLPGLGTSNRGGSGGGGSMGGTSRPASPGRAGGTGRMATTGTHRPPSHQENY